MTDRKKLKDNNYSFISLKSDSSFMSNKQFDLEEHAGDVQDFTLNTRFSRPSRKNLLPRSIERMPKPEFREIECVSCLKYCKELEELKKQFDHLNEKMFTTEKHLKQYDTLLQIKDKRLEQEAAALKIEKELLEKNSERFFKEKIVVDREKEEILIEKEKIKLKNLEIFEKIKEIDERQSEFEDEIRFREDEIVKLTEEKEELERKIREISRNEGKFIIAEENYAEYLPENNKKSTDSSYSLNKENSEIQEKLLRLESREKKNTEEKIALESMKENLEEEHRFVNELKQVLKIQEDNLKKEEKLLREKTQEDEEVILDLKEKIKDLAKEKNNIEDRTASLIKDLKIETGKLRNEIEHIEEKRKYLEDNNKFLLKKNCDLEKNIKKMIDSEFILLNKNSELENKINLLNERNLKISEEIGTDRPSEVIKIIIDEFEKKTLRLIEKIQEIDTSEFESKGSGFEEAARAVKEKIVIIVMNERERNGYFFSQMEDKGLIRYGGERGLNLMKVDNESRSNDEEGRSEDDFE